MENKDLTGIVTPIKIDEFEHQLKQASYDKDEIKYLVRGFTEGFSIGYKGPYNRTDKSRNIPFNVGDKYDLWEKMMKEVEAGCFAGPFEDIPKRFQNSYVQSPVGLVPKAGGKTRLIYHLSYQFENGNQSINYWTPIEDCTVKYQDLDCVVRHCLDLLRRSNASGKTLVFSKSDLVSAFRNLPIFVNHRRFLIMKAECPGTPGKYLYFMDKCLPFRASISCKHFQRFSNALKAIVQRAIEVRTLIRDAEITNYLDDFLFICFCLIQCSKAMETFLQVCEEIGCPVSLEKTEGPAEIMVFLGILMDGKHRQLSVPVEKRDIILDMVRRFINNKKATVKELQQLTGHLNFLSRAIVPGRTFTRRMYNKFKSSIITKNGQQLKHFHHIRLDREFKEDCKMWEEFLQEPQAVN